MRLHLGWFVTIYRKLEKKKNAQGKMCLYMAFCQNQHGWQGQREIKQKDAELLVSGSKDRIQDCPRG